MFVLYVFDIAQAVELNSNIDLDDYWTQQDSSTATPSEPYLSVETIEGIEPLDMQFGVADPKTVPDILYGPLFGQPEPTESELEQARGDSGQVPPLHTYAILDAAKVLGLPELLAASGLEHRCLFKGDAFEELKDVAPWIVRIEEGNSLVRNLFTRSDALWHLWDNEPGIYLRSRGTLDEMWGHFRKFTKVQDEQGKWYYLRLHDPKTMIYYLDGMKASHVRVKQVFMPRVSPEIACIVAVSLRHRTASVFRSHVRGDTQNAGGEAFELDIRYTEGFLEASIALLRGYAPELSNTSDRDLMWLARQNIPSFHQFDLVSKPVIANTLAIVALSKHPLDRLSETDQRLLRDKSQSQFRRTSILLQQIKQRAFAQHG